MVNHNRETGNRNLKTHNLDLEPACTLNSYKSPAAPRGPAGTHGQSDHSQTCGTHVTTVDQQRFSGQPSQSESSKSRTAISIWLTIDHLHVQNSSCLPLCGQAEWMDFGNLTNIIIHHARKIILILSTCEKAWYDPSSVCNLPQHNLWRCLEGTLDNWIAIRHHHQT